MLGNLRVIAGTRHGFQLYWLIKNIGKSIVTSYIVTFTFFIYSAPSASDLIEEPPIAAGFSYGSHGKAYLYPNPDKLGEHACSDINATQSPDQLRIFGPIVFSRAIVSSHATELLVYCSQNGNELPASLFGAAIAGWHIDCAPGATPDSQAAYPVNPIFLS